MKIGIYSDTHISRTSSILPTYENESEYTTRLNMCKNSLNWAYKEFEKRNVNLVINTGDTFNSHNISSDEMSTYVEFIKSSFNPYDAWTPELDITIIGNHDKFNDKFNSLDLLKLTDYTHLVQDYYYCDRENIDVYAISFYDANEFCNKILEMLEKYPKQHDKAILFMHGDINGSCLTGIKRIENHIPTDFLTQYFDIIFNGHIHCHELIYNKNNKKIYNIGSLTSHSFADSNNHIPACWIYDTELDELTRVDNPYAILFKTYDISTEEAIVTMKDNISKNVNFHILKLKMPYSLKEYAENIINSLSNVLKYKFIFTYNNEIIDEKENNKEKIILTSNDIKDEFIEFLSQRDDLKDNLDKYISII